MKKNIVISHVYSNHNTGDAAILSVLISDVKKAYPESNISILTFDKVHRSEMFENIPIHQSFMGHALTDLSFRPLKFFYALYIMLGTLIAAFLKKLHINFSVGYRLTKAYMLYQNADLVIGVGGGYLRGRPGLTSTIELLLQLHPLFLVKLLGKKTILYSQSIGPFGNRFQKFIARRALCGVELIIAREDVTVNFLKNMGIEKNVTRSVDAAFALHSESKLNIRELLNIPTNRKIVGITVRKWLSQDAQTKFESALAETADYFATQGYAVVFIPQVTSISHNDDDRIANQDVYDHMKVKANVYLLKEQFDHHQIKSLYSGIALLIGTRFHSAIFALTSHVPSIAIEYEHKTSGIMNDLGLNDWVIKIEDVTSGKLFSLSKNLITGQASYKKYLQKIVPEYTKRAQSTYKLLHLEGSK